MTTSAPICKVFTIVFKQVVAARADSPTGTTDDLGPVETDLRIHFLDWLALPENCQRNFLNDGIFPVKDTATKMDDPSIFAGNAVMMIGSKSDCQMRTGLETGFCWLMVQIPTFDDLLGLLLHQHHTERIEIHRDRRTSTRVFDGKTTIFRFTANWTVCPEKLQTGKMGRVCRLPRIRPTQTRGNVDTSISSSCPDHECLWANSTGKN